MSKKSIIFLALTLVVFGLGYIVASTAKDIVPDMFDFEDDFEEEEVC